MGVGRRFGVGSLGLYRGRGWPIPAPARSVFAHQTHTVPILHKPSPGAKPHPKAAGAKPRIYSSVGPGGVFPGGAKPQESTKILKLLHISAAPW